MANTWWEIKIVCDPDLEDSIFWRLENFGCRGTASEKQESYRLVKAYLPQFRAEILDLAALSLWLRQDALRMGASAPTLQWQLIDEQDWATNWKQHWQPLEIGDRLIINPAWLPPPLGDRLILNLDPGVAFGTGNHATTQLCLESLEMRLSEIPTSFVDTGVKKDGVEKDGVEIADIGCGSGILSIGAILLGAKKVYAVDIDPLAVKSTSENAALNNIITNLLIGEGSVESVKQMISAPVDGIVCNILADVIVNLIPELSAIAKPSTWGIFSGILLDQSNNVSDVLEKNGWVVATLWKRKEWCCLNVRRS